MKTQTVINGVTPPPGPKRTTEITQAAVRAYIVRHDFNFGDIDEAVDDITAAFRPDMDGYELAKCLESDYDWGSLCLQDAQDLDGISAVVLDAEEVARKEWVAQWDIKPSLAIGTHIQQGVITGVSKYMAARYLVKEYGCTQKWRPLIVKFEDAVIAVQKETA